ncbi:MAG: methylmalonyl Co-A mutase-associated GTPase MeaB, partial [Ignavibacteriales bacterium]|nr:methylmalonyl Co-A mutase-associated GTPase MeaB [Ignavibacteriales bacterium]
DRALLARAITLVESSSKTRRDEAREILEALAPKAGGSLRVGVSGSPGAGKSTFIETLGMRLLRAGKRVAVLAVDPSSAVTRGSILGDKTRMERLSREPNCFIRPSPSAGALGGVTRKSRESIVLLEAAGYDVTLVETVGVGQNEIAVRSMVDFFLLLVAPGGGDELQGVKKGVVEIADAIAVNKSDGDLKAAADRARQEYANALHYLAPRSRSWAPRVFQCSAVEDEGVADIWENVLEFELNAKADGSFERRRREQAIEWTLGVVEDELLREFRENDVVQNALPVIKERARKGDLLPGAAAEELLRLFRDAR